MSTFIFIYNATQMGTFLWICIQYLIS